ncbi:flagellar operon protein [Gracilibacillus ureilyticus]|uniref:Flagellar operon protein n=1 Tax=Gracilibacillus ureilyticus TaxID=531814 RepID=A0A1H9L4V3_9BACI|nr:TIGR02530 family flagellar biosynthesis protein [Gracilibacillus ureilyticus]SER06474.1 flagellar operon protein [Gracilibacillus ureilyticus]
MNTKIHALHHPVIPGNQTAKHVKTNSNFSELLQQESKLNISKHAQQRMDARNILINDEKWSQMETKISEAKQKGIKESLVLMENAAFIVNVNNNTVITAMERAETKSKIFTNINGTILID